MIPQVEIYNDNNNNENEKLLEQQKSDMDAYFEETVQHGVTTYNENDQKSESNFDEDLYKKKRYVPVALVLSTETEYHDFFKQLMLAMFDLIRVPPEEYQIPGHYYPCGK